MREEKVTFRLTEEEKQRIVELAAERDIPVSQLIRELCKEIFNGGKSND